MKLRFLLYFTDTYMALSMHGLAVVQPQGFFELKVCTAALTFASSAARLSVLSQGGSGGLV